MKLRQYLHVLEIFFFGCMNLKKLDSFHLPPKDTQNQQKLPPSSSLILPSSFESRYSDLSLPPSPTHHPFPPLPTHPVSRYTRPCAVRHFAWLRAFVFCVYVFFRHLGFILQQWQMVLKRRQRQEAQGSQQGTWEEQFSIRLLQRRAGCTGLALWPLWTAATSLLTSRSEWLFPFVSPCGLLIFFLVYWRFASEHKIERSDVCCLYIFACGE